LAPPRLQAAATGAASPGDPLLRPTSSTARLNAITNIVISCKAIDRKKIFVGTWNMKNVI
jgi:hypothetical protein